MVLNKTKLVVTHKIRKLLKKYNLGLMFLKSSKFRHMLKIWKQDRNTIAVALMQADLIIVDEEFALHAKLSQAQLNYLILHEIGHNGKRNWGEKAAHASALGLARYYNISIDYDGVILEEK